MKRWLVLLVFLIASVALARAFGTLPVAWCVGYVTGLFAPDITRSRTPR